MVLFQCFTFRFVKNITFEHLASKKLKKLKCSAFGNNKECQSLNFNLNWHLSNKANVHAGCKPSSICQYQVYLCWCRNEWSLFNFHWHQMRKLHKENCNLSLQQCPFGKSMNEPLRLKYLPKLCITYILKDMYIFFFSDMDKLFCKTIQL